MIKIAQSLFSADLSRPAKQIRTVGEEDTISCAWLFGKGDLRENMKIHKIIDN